VFLLAFGFEAFAEEPDEQVVVEASRTDTPIASLPVSATVVDALPLQSPGPGVSLAELTLTVPGLLVRDRTNAAQGPRVSIRGFGTEAAFGVRGITVLLDGIPLTLADGQAQIDLVDPDLLGRIEVLRGPSGALYGNAAGGVLALETAGGAERTGEDVLVRAGAYGQGKVVARAAETFPSGDATIAASGSTSEGYRDRSAAQKAIVLGSARWRPTDATELRFVASIVDAPKSEDPGGLTADEMAADPTQAAPNNIEFDAGEEVIQAQTGASLRARISRGESIRVAAYHIGRSYSASVPFTYIALDREAGGGLASFHSDRSPAGHDTHLTAAIEVQTLHDLRTTFENDGGLPTSTVMLHQVEAVTALGAYGNAQVTLVGPLDLLAGIRHDRSSFTLEDRLPEDGTSDDSRRFDATTGIVGLGLRPAAGWLLYANASNAYQTPTVSELALRPDGEAGFVDDLDPQRARNAELGARLLRGAVTAEADVFATSLEDELVPFSDDTGRTYYRNAGRSHRWGAELATNLALPADLSLAVAYTAIVAQFDDYVLDGAQLQGNTVPGIPPHRVGATAGWGRVTGPFVATDAEVVAAIEANDTNDEQSDPFTIVGARAGWRGFVGRARWELQVGGQNLLDQDVVDNLRVNADGGRFYEPGWPRSFFGSATIGWARRP
jgi:iron complex outermembrane receptor protein